MKWTLGVKKTTSNAAIWGETGRYPLAVKLIKQMVAYFERLKSKSFDKNCASLVKDAFKEQQALNLSWFANIAAVKSLIQKKYPEK